MTSLNFLSTSNNIIFAGDISYKSTNQGIDWTTVLATTPLSPNDRSICFSDSLYGWALRNNSSIYKTVDGGKTWSIININLGFYYINGISFINRNTGWISAESDGAIHQIAKTTNGGNSWTIIANNLSFQPGQIIMFNANKGVVMAISSPPFANNIATTSNGGYGWSYQNVGDGMPVSMLFFLDSLKGWAAGLVDYTARTSNGGINWILMPNSIGNPGSIFFVDSANGWISENSSHRYVWKTTNKGLNWEINRTLTPDQCMDIYFKNINEGWMSVSNGILWKTSDGGTNWIAQIEPTSINSMDFINSNTGWTVSPSIPRLLKTTNRGYNWMTMSALNAPYRYVDFVNPQTGYLCGDSGMLGKTTDGGVTLTNTRFGNTIFSTVFFVNETTGWVCGSGGTILKTINGGANWSAQQSNVTSNLPDCYFIDSQNGFIPADGGYVLKTTNGGANWIVLYPYGDYTYYSVHFVSTLTGFLVGNKSYGGFPPTVMRVLIKTTDGGLNWTHPIEQSYVGFGSYNDVFFCNPQTGWIVMDNGNKGYITKTTNGGENWFQVFGPIGANDPNGGGLYSIFSLGEEYTWVSGENDILLSTSSPIGIQNVSSQVPFHFLLSQNYPNPFNPQTKIKFDIPANVRGQSSNVKLVIYDLLGREVTTLVNEELKPGTYEADWDGSAYSSGVYFYKIITESFVETKKMVLMK